MSYSQIKYKANIHKKLNNNALNIIKNIVNNITLNIIKNNVSNIKN